ncbi:hypothetical protein [Streptacidiphilus albus]|uniref:hypothetical protein n=1 Tax=Streptacidiphilus albus TaxID=105425 RepID=UPI0005AAD344|nr:hypothetical protein [Streptacidiphilus albus]
MSIGRVRRLRQDDAEEILRIADLEGLDAPTLARELANGDDYLWLGVTTQSGVLGAVHRSMRWGDRLLLKGVFVDEPLRGSGAALELGFRLRDTARDAGYRGVLAWVEPHRPEAGLARMLRLQATGLLVHRFEVPLPDCIGPSTVTAASCGTVAFGQSGTGSRAPLVTDMLGDGISGTVQWVHDRHRLVLSGFPSPTIADLATLAAQLRPLAQATGAGFVEFPLPAADLSAALALTRSNARRLSRTPVRLGFLDFHSASDPEGRTVAVDAA